MEDLSNKILVLTTITNGVCVGDSFISLANNLASSMGRDIDYFSFNKNSGYPEVIDLVDKDTLDRLSYSISRYDFILIDKRLDTATLNIIVGFILSEGNQIGSFYVDDIELQSYIESKILLRKDLNKSDKELLTVSSDGSGEDDPVSIEEALDFLIKDNYNKIRFLEGNYEISFLYQVLSYCYDTGVILIDSVLPKGAYINVINSKW